MTLAMALVAGVLGINAPAAHADPPTSTVEQHWELLPQTYLGLTGSTTMPVHRGALPGGTMRFDPAPTATFVVVANVGYGGFTGWDVALRDAAGSWIADLDLVSPTNGSYQVFTASFGWPSADRTLADIVAIPQTGNIRTLDIKKAYVELRQSGTVKKIVGRYPIGVRQDAISSTSWVDVADRIFYRHNAREFDPAPTVRLRVSGRASQSCAWLESRLVNASGVAAGYPVSNGGTAWFSNSDTVSLVDGATYRLQVRLQNPGCPLALTADLLSADLVFEQSTTDANGILRTVGVYPGVSAATEASMAGAALGFPFDGPDNNVKAQTGAFFDVSMKRISGTGNAGVKLINTGGVDPTVSTVSGSYVHLNTPVSSLPGASTNLDTATITASSTTGRISQTVLRTALRLRSDVIDMQQLDVLEVVIGGSSSLDLTSDPDGVWIDGAESGQARLRTQGGTLIDTYNPEPQALTQTPFPGFPCVDSGSEEVKVGPVKPISGDWPIPHNYLFHRYHAPSARQIGETWMRQIMFCAIGGAESDWDAVEVMLSGPAMAWSGIDGDDQATQPHTTKRIGWIWPDEVDPPSTTSVSLGFQLAAGPASVSAEMTQAAGARLTGTIFLGPMPSYLDTYQNEAVHGWWEDGCWPNDVCWDPGSPNYQGSISQGLWEFDHNATAGKHIDFGRVGHVAITCKNLVCGILYDELP